MIAERGTLEIFQNISTLPPDYTEGGATAHVEVHPNGKWAYASNRGHDSIVGFNVAADGLLSVVRTFFDFRESDDHSISIQRAPICTVPVSLQTQ